MPDLQYRQQKIQEKRKQTPRREFVREMSCRRPIMLYTNQWHISRYPEERVKNIALDAPERIISWSYSGDLFASFSELFYTQALLPTTSYYGNENSDYSDGSFGGKNIYLSFDVGGGSENIAYSHLVYDESYHVYQSVLVWASTHVFDSSHIHQSHTIFRSHSIRECSHIASSYNLVWCTYCIDCNDLQHQSYCIKNTRVSPEVFAKARQVMNHENISSWGHPHKINDAFLCTNCEHILHCDHLQDCRNVIFGAWGDASSDIYDSVNVWLNSEHLYAVSTCWDHSAHLYCVAEVASSSHCFYCYYLEWCSYCLGCIWLKNKSFCILNKQYTKKERHQKVDEIFGAMEKEGALGDFFPWSMNPFYFNDTAAYLIDESFTKEEVEAEGYLWREEKVKVDIPEGMEVVGTSELREYEKRNPSTGSGWQDTSWWIDPEIMKKVIQDEEGNIYRIVKMEYDFLMKHGLPLPRLHRLDRLKMNFKIK